MKRLKGRAKPTSDIAAKKIFSYELATLNFIRDILDIPANKVTILDGTQIYLTNDDLLNNFNTSIDVLTELDDGTQVIIEIQIVKQTAFINRLWVYICKQVVDNFEKLKLSDNKTHTLYKDVKPVYSIVIFEHNYFNDDEPLHTFSLREDKKYNELYMTLNNKTKCNPLRLAFLELKKYNTLKLDDYNKKKWFEFFSNEEFTIKPDNLILQLENILNTKNWSKEEKSMYDEKTRTEDMRLAELDYARDEGIEQGIEKGIKKGIALGKAEERNKIMRISISTMINSGVSLEQIKNAFNLTDEQLSSFLGK